MLTIAILSIVLVPVLLDLVIRRFHTANELSMQRPD